VGWVLELLARDPLRLPGAALMSVATVRAAYQRVTEEASRLYIPCAPSEAWREAVKRADEAWKKLLTERKVKR
jgi:hypothetical protein